MNSLAILGLKKKGRPEGGHRFERGGEGCYATAGAAEAATSGASIAAGASAVTLSR